MNYFKIPIVSFQQTFNFVFNSATINIPKNTKKISLRGLFVMRQMNFLKLFILVLLCSVSSFSQSGQTPPVIIEMVSEDDLTPGVVKALPDYEKVKDKATHIKNTAELKKLFGNDRGVLDLIDFKGGNEAAAADYEAGKLLIVEFASPQASFEVDNQIKQRLAESPQNPPVYYRRVGNYNVFLFDGKNELAANELLTKIKYEKSVKWLGEDPFYYNRAERHFVQNTLQLFLTTILAIGLILGAMLILGIVAGIFYFRITNRRREAMAAFSDAGGMIRLNLDDLTSEVSPDRLLQ
jgi:hypothetical protein